MIDVLYQLTRPWAYLLIRYESRIIYNVYVPLILTFITAAPLTYFYLTNHIDIFSKAGLIKDFVSFLSTLPGFFIAALAAIATFANPEMDQLMPAKPVLISTSPQGNKIPIELTRRRFLCILFAFLSAQSLMVCLIALLVVHSCESLKIIIVNSVMQTTIGVFGLWFFMFLIWHLLSATALGLYYLGDKIHHAKA